MTKKGFSTDFVAAMNLARKPKTGKASKQLKRRPISMRTRFRILQRDGFSCAYCGSRPPNARLHVDHIVAVSLGGSDSDANLITACDECNLGKGALALNGYLGVPDE